MTQVYYDRDQTVAIITSFYQFFATLPSISPSDIAYPPPGGWPDITPETHAALQKNDDVIDLYKHLPYLNKRPEISYLTYASDWRLQNIESKIQSEAVEESAVGPLPDYVAILTDGNKYGSYLLLDTQNGRLKVNCLCFDRGVADVRIRNYHGFPKTRASQTKGTSRRFA